MTSRELAALLERMTRAAQAKNGRDFAACFTEDGIYRDDIYGDHAGRAAIADMLENYFHRDATEYRWQFFDAICDGDTGYAWSLSSFASTIPEFAGRHVTIDGISRFRLKDGLIAEYFASVNGGVAMAQLGVQPERNERGDAPLGRPAQPTSRNRRLQGRRAIPSKGAVTWPRSKSKPPRTCSPMSARKSASATGSP